MATASRSTCLGIFAKYWTPGQVKTRLAKDLGDTAAAEIARAFLLHLTTTLGPVATENRILVTPDEKSLEVQQILASSWGTWEQGAGDLSQRLSNFFQRALLKSESALAVGADCCDLPRDYLGDAFKKLDSHEVVVGPAHDGGYCLIGFRGPWKANYAEAFRDIPWGTNRVYAETLQRLARSSLSYSSLKPWWDVDTPADLKLLFQRLDDSPLKTLLRKYVT